MKAIKDLCYLFGIWIVMRFHPLGAAYLLEQWALGIKQYNK